MSPAKPFATETLEAAVAHQEEDWVVLDEDHRSEDQVSVLASTGGSDAVPCNDIRLTPLTLDEALAQITHLQTSLNKKTFEHSEYQKKYFSNVSRLEQELERFRRQNKELLKRMNESEQELTLVKEPGRSLSSRGPRNMHISIPATRHAARSGVATPSPTTPEFPHFSPTEPVTVKKVSWRRA